MKNNRKTSKHQCLSGKFSLKIVAVWVFLAMSMTAFSQGKTDTGVGIDNQNETIIGANVIVVGTLNCTTNDNDGEFSVLTVSPTDKLQISYIGYTTATVAVGSTSHVRTVL